MRDALWNAGLLIVVLGGAAVFTQLFTRAMYLRCPSCKILNAKRREHCRACGHLLRLN